MKAGKNVNLLNVTLSALLVLALLAAPIATLSEAPEVNLSWFVVGSEGVTLTAQSGAGAAELRALLPGQTVGLITTQGNEAQVMAYSPAGDLLLGWVPYAALTPTGAPMMAVVQSGTLGTRALLHTGAGRNAKVLAKYNDGTVVQLLNGPDNGAVRVQVGQLDGFMKESDLAVGWPAEGFAAAIPTAVVSSAEYASLSLRDAPNYQSNKIGAVPNGQPVRVLGLTEEFAHVLTERGEIGFVMASGLSPHPAYSDAAAAMAPVPEPDGYQTVVENLDGQGAHLRTRASTASDSLGLYPNGTHVVVTGGGTWWKTVWVDGKTGYMMGKLLRGFVPVEPTVDPYY